MIWGVLRDLGVLREDFADLLGDRLVDLEAWLDENQVGNPRKLRSAISKPIGNRHFQDRSVMHGSSRSLRSSTIVSGFTSPSFRQPKE
jgi:hypothetical protein